MEVKNVIGKMNVLREELNKTMALSEQEKQEKLKVNWKKYEELMMKNFEIPANTPIDAFMVIYLIDKVIDMREKEKKIIV